MQPSQREIFARIFHAIIHVVHFLMMMGYFYTSFIKEGGKAYSLTSPSHW